MARGCSTAVRALTKQVLAHVGGTLLGVDGRQDVGGNVRRRPAAFVGAAPVFLRGARERVGIGHQVEHAECDGARGRGMTVGCAVLPRQKAARAQFGMAVVRSPCAT